jgi:H+/Cl- antiporter ClcA
MFPMTASVTGQLRAAVVALVAALLALIVSYKTFLWALIKYWEWQHDGRRMKVTFWADERALPLALLVCAIVFFVTFKYIQQRRKS